MSEARAATMNPRDAGATSGDAVDSHSPRPRRLLRQWLADALVARSLTFRASMSRSWPFRILMAGSSISMIGSRISTIAFPMLVLSINKSPFIAGLVTFAAIVPSMLAYIPAGALVDRWDPWRVMLMSEIFRGIAMMAVVLSLLLAGGHVSIYLLISFMVAEEILEVFWLLADRRYMSQLMEREKIAEGQASIEVRAHAAALAGRPTVPFLFAVTHFLPFLADAVSFAVSVWTLMALKGRRVLAENPRKEPHGRLRTEIGEGFRWLLKDWHAGATQLLMAFTTLIAQALIMIFLVEARDGRLSTVAIAVVLAASGAGGAIGSAAATRLPEWIRESWPKLQLCAWSAALGLLAFTGVRFPWCIALAMLILGFTGSIGNIRFGAYLFLKAEDGMLGRVISIGQVMTIGAYGLGPFVGGGVIQFLGGSAIRKLGIQAPVVVFLCLVSIVTLSSFLVPWISLLTTRRGAAESTEGTHSGAASRESSLPVQAVPGSSSEIFDARKWSTAGDG